jgi:hypothetical protein
MLQAREARIRSAVASAKEQHSRAMARLRERYCSMEGVAPEKVGWRTMCDGRGDCRLSAALQQGA